MSSPTWIKADVGSPSQLCTVPSATSSTNCPKLEYNLVGMPTVQSWDAIGDFKQQEQIEIWLGMISNAFNERQSYPSSVLSATSLADLVDAHSLRNSAGQHPSPEFLESVKGCVRARQATGQAITAAQSSLDEARKSIEESGGLPESWKCGVQPWDDFYYNEAVGLRQVCPWMSDSIAVSVPEDLLNVIHYNWRLALESMLDSNKLGEAWAMAREADAREEELEGSEVSYGASSEEGGSEVERCQGGLTYKIEDGEEKTRTVLRFDEVTKSVKDRFGENLTVMTIPTCAFKVNRPEVTTLGEPGKDWVVDEF